MSIRDLRTARSLGIARDLRMVRRICDPGRSVIIAWRNLHHYKSILFKNIHDIHDLIFETSYKNDHWNSKTTTGKRFKWLNWYWNENVQIFFIFTFDSNCWIVSIFWMGIIRSAKNSRFLSTFILSAEPGFSIFIIAIQFIQNARRISGFRVN